MNRQKKSWLLVAFLMSAGMLCQAQDKYFTKTGKISFYSITSLENVEAVNKTAGAILDAKTGSVQFAALMKGFEFKKALMQEHFNENYIESDQYPKAEFRGSIINNADVNYAKDGTYPVKVKGQLTLHGTSKEVEAPGTLQIQGGKVDVSSTFTVLVSDFKISIPSIVKDKINNNVKVVVEAHLDPLKM